jgi:5-formyltetrahydrofolate cyclo-ligase
MALSGDKQARKALREHLRQSRRSMPRREREQACKRLAARVTRERAVRDATRIGAYLASDGETDVGLLIDWALAQGKHVYLPIIRTDRHLDFARFRHGTRLVANRFGILEPARAGRELISPRRLDVVLTPLVGFDACAHRLGMGGGYYDRSFAALNSWRSWPRPRLLGIAFDCQRVCALDMAPWDVPLWRVITESSRYPTSRGPA